MFAEIHKQYFKGMNMEQVKDVLIKVLDAWFAAEGGANV